MTRQSNTLFVALTILGGACAADAVAPTLQLDDLHHASLESLNLEARAVGSDTLLLLDMDGNTVAEAWTQIAGQAEVAWGSTYVTVANDADRVTLTCNDVPFVMVRDVRGEWIADSTTPISTVPSECYDPITVGRVVASASRPTLPVEQDEVVGATQALCAGGGGTCYTQWGLSASSACSAAHSDCRDGAGRDTVDFCEKSGNAQCGSVYCTCTYCDPCQTGFAAEAELEF